MAQHLTDAVIKRLKPPAKGNHITYDEVAGFGIRITAAGHRAFILNYRTRSGRERRFTIGGWPDWNATDARAQARRLKRLIDEGGDPLADLEAEREAPTVADLCDRFEKEHLPRMRPSSAADYKRMIANHIRPALKHLKVADVAYADIDKLHHKITARGHLHRANRTIAVLSKMFSLAMRWAMRPDNPCKHIERNQETKRKRYLSAAELARLTTALVEHPDQQAANIVRLLLLTGARRGEVLAAKWADIDLGTGTWTKPGSTTKQKTDHVVPLSAPARQLLAEIRDAQTSKHPKRPLGEYVFPGTGGHVVEIKKAWRTICKAAAIDGLRVHDLRHSFASQLASGGATLPLIGALLGHSNPTTTHRYAHLFDDPQRAAVEKVGAVITAAGKPVTEPMTIKRVRS
jgi:integrase